MRMIPSRAAKKLKSIAVKVLLFIAIQALYVA